MKNPLHKRIGHHVRKYHRHFTKYLYERDTILATLSVFVFLILLGMIKLNFYVLNPLKLALKDFDFNDIAYAKLEKGADSIDRRIAIVNVGDADREEIAYLIESVSAMQPKVIGLDILFEGEREEDKDSILREVLKKTKNLVSVSRLIPVDDKIIVDPNYFDSSISIRGAANLIGEDIGTIRHYVPFEEVSGKKYPHITSAIVREYDKSVYEKLENRHKAVETINYTRKINEESIRDLKGYQIIQSEDIMMGNVEDYLIKDKIVLLGYVNPNPNDIEDKKFTPMNHKYAGKSVPDMNGVVVQANIISMVLDNNYIKKTPKWVAWLVAVLIGWIHMSLFIRYYLEDHIWFHLVAKMAQVFSAIFFAYLGILIFDKFGIKLDMKYTLYVIILAVDVIYFYEALVAWLHKKFGFKTVFHQQHHG